MEFCILTPKIAAEGTAKWESQKRIQREKEIRTENEK